MPVPRFISASCGIALRILPEKREEAENLFKEGSTLAAAEYAYYHIETRRDEGDSACERIEIV